MARLVESILKEAVALSKVDRDQLMIARAQSVTWSDGSLGCPEPGMMYTQALVNGYWVVIQAADQNYDFRVGSGGSLPIVPAWPRPFASTAWRKPVRRHILSSRRRAVVAGTMYSSLQKIPSFAALHKRGATQRGFRHEITQARYCPVLCAGGGSLIALPGTFIRGRKIYYI